MSLFEFWSRSVLFRVRLDLVYFNGICPRSLLLLLVVMVELAILNKLLLDIVHIRLLFDILPIYDIEELLELQLFDNMLNVLVHSLQERP